MLKNIICKKQSHINKLPDVLIDNNREYKADETTEGFNTFFTNIGSNLAKRITLQSGSFYDALPNSNCNSMLLSKTDAKEILSIVKKFSNKSTLDCNDMSMSIIKEIIPFVVNPFTYICNLSFYSGDFPNCNENQSINQGLFSIQTNNNNNIHTFVYMNTERAGNEVKLLM